MKIIRIRPVITSVFYWLIDESGWGVMLTYGKKDRQWMMHDTFPARFADIEEVREVFKPFVAGPHTINIRRDVWGDGKAEIIERPGKEREA